MARDGFGRLAGIYEGLERLVYGNLLMRSRTALLDSLAHAENVLILGARAMGVFWFKLLEDQSALFSDGARQQRGDAGAG